MTTSPINLVILISGAGTNLQALIDAPLPHTNITAVISNRKAAYGLVRARTAGIDTHVHNLISGGYTSRFPAAAAAAAASSSSSSSTPANPPKPTASNEARRAYDADLAALVLAQRPHIVVLAGFMHILSPRFLDPLAEAGVEIVNLHPALPGAYSGVNAIERAWADWEAGRLTATGCMLHRVIAEVDMGAPVVVREVAFQSGESRDQFEARFHAVEHEVIVQGVAKVVDEVLRRRKKQPAEEGKGGWMR